MAGWIGAQDQVTSSRKAQKLPHLWRYPQKNTNPKLKVF